MLNLKLQTSLNNKKQKKFFEDDPIGVLNVVFGEFKNEVATTLNEFRETILEQVDKKHRDFEEEVKEMPEFPVNKALTKVIESIALKVGEDFKGEKGDTPKVGIDFEQPEDGEDYVLTDDDKKEIAGMIIPPVIEKVIEKTEVVKEQPIHYETVKVTNEIKEVAKYEEAPVIASKLNTLTEVLSIDVIAGLNEWMKKVQRRLESGGSASAGKGGGMGNPQHEEFTVTTATTTITTAYPIAAGGYAVMNCRYQGQALDFGTHYTVGSDHRTITLDSTMTAQITDGDKISITYIRG